MAKKMKFATFHSLTIVNLSLHFIKIRARTKQDFKGDSEQIKTKISMITSGVHIICLPLSEFTISLFKVFSRTKTFLFLKKVFK